MNPSGHRFPLGLGATVCSIASLLGFMSTCGWSQLIGWMAAGCWLVGWLMRGRWAYKTSYAIILSFLLLMASLSVGDRTALQTNFVSAATMRLALSTVCALGLFQGWRYSQIGQRAFCCLAVVSHMISLVMMGGINETWPVALQAIGLAIFVSDEQQAPVVKGKLSKSRLLARLAPLVLASVCAVALISVFRWSDSKVNWLMSLINVPPAGSLRFPERSALSRMARSNENPAVLARYYCENPSLYLISRTYSTYQQGSWESPKAFQVVNGQERGDLNRYQMSSVKSEKLIEEFVEVAESSPGPLFPRDAQTLDVEPSVLNRSFGESYSYPKGASEAPIRFQRSTGSAQQAFETQFGSDERSALLQVPDPLKKSLLEISQAWLDESKLKPSDLSQEQLAHRMENYLQNHYEYGFGYPFDNNYEPIISFLKIKPPAHCELFAASLTLILRSHGIPARYVVGFLAREYNNSGGYATIRVRDAHAWVEAYFEGKGWVTLDATPSVAREAPKGASHWLEDLSDAFHTFFKKVWTQNWKDSLIQGWRLFKPLFPVAVVVVGLNLLMRLRLRMKAKPKKRLVAPVQTLEVLVSESQHLLQEVETAWAKAGYSRPAHLTLQRWCDQLRQQVPQESNQLAEFLALYQDLRYGQASVEPERMQTLVQSAQKASQSAPRSAEPSR